MDISVTLVRDQAGRFKLLQPQTNSMGTRAEIAQAAEAANALEAEVDLLVRQTKELDGASSDLDERAGQIETFTPLAPEQPGDKLTEKRRLSSNADGEVNEFRHNVEGVLVMKPDDWWRFGTGQTEPLHLRNGTSCDSKNGLTIGRDRWVEDPNDSGRLSYENLGILEREPGVFNFYHRTTDTLHATRP